MMSFEYVVAWSIYLIAGCCLTYIGLQLSRSWQPAALRDLIRGSVIVLIFTPWYAGESTAHYAPAALVFAFELLFIDSEQGVNSGYALLTTFSVMLVVLAGLELKRKA